MTAIIGMLLIHLLALVFDILKTRVKKSLRKKSPKKLPNPLLSKFMLTFTVEKSSPKLG
jgi:hypothetical protein